MNIQESGQMYLETIYILSLKKDKVHAIDISRYMNFSKPSVSRAIGLLKDEGLISVETDGAISLTDNGVETACAIYEKHRLLTDIFISLGVSEETAEQDACRIEHVLSDETFNAIRNHVSENTNKKTATLK